MNFDIGSLTDVFDKKELSQLMNADGPSDIVQVIGPMIEEELQPHFDDIRERAESTDYEEAKRYYDSLDASERGDLFQKSAADLIRTLRMCREHPVQGYPMLKQRLRDPDVFEPLLFVLDDDDHVDEEYSREKKEMLRDMATWAGVSVLPEIYTDAEKSDIERRLGGE